MNLRGQAGRKPLEELYEIYVASRKRALERITSRYLNLNKIVVSLVRGE